MALTDGKALLFHTVKFEIELSEKQLQTLKAISESLRLLWNAALEQRQWAYRLGRPINYISQQNELTPLRAENSEYAAINRSSEEAVLHTLDSSFKSFFALVKKGDYKARPPQYKSHKYFFSFMMRGSGYKVKNGRIRLFCDLPDAAELDWPVPQYVTETLNGYKVKKLTLYRDPARLDRPGKFWISLAYEIPAPEPIGEITGEDVVFIDIGSQAIGVIAGDKEIVFKQWRPDKYWAGKIASVQKRRDRHRKFSNRWWRYDAAKRKMEKIMSRQLLDYQRNIVKKILALGKVFVVGDIDVRLGLADSENKDRTRLNWAVQNTGSISRIIRLLKVKANEQGKQVIEIKEYHTSSECSVCGESQDYLRVGADDFSDELNCATCGAKMPRKINGARNIRARWLAGWQ